MEIHDLLREAVRRSASDLHCTTKAFPALRVGGKIIDLPSGKLTGDEISAFIQTIADENQRKELAASGEVDFSFSIEEIGRFRANAYMQRGETSLAVRIIPGEIPPLGTLGLPPAVRNLANKARGLVIATGPTGAGKTTTLAALIDAINDTRRANIITLEDPIEYLHQNKRCLINQREIKSDTKTFASGLRAALREDPDIILVGEMRDLETISIALTAAETGHLVLTTLHTGGAAQTVDRIIDVFPAAQQQQIRTQLSLTLQGVIAQQLLPTKTGGRALAAEVMLVSPAIRNLIREGKTHQIAATIQTSAKDGMKLMDTSIRELLQEGIIDLKTAMMAANEPEKMEGANR